MPDSSDVRREIEDRLITTGVAASRVTAGRWALDAGRWALGRAAEAGA